MSIDLDTRLLLFIVFRINKEIIKMDNFRQRLCFSSPTVSDISLDHERNNVRRLYFIIMP